MIIQYCSDLHLEFPENKKFIEENPIECNGDILILAGDIMPFGQIDDHKVFFDRLSDQFQQVYWLPGNHEYYYTDLDGRSGSFNEQIRKNITLLNNSIIQVGNISLVFSTLWTYISKPKSKIIQERLSDFFLIKNHTKPLIVDEYNSMHLSCISFIKNALEYSTDKKTVVITHHVPTLQNYPIQYLGSPVNEAFVVDLSELIEIFQPDYWIYGHSHINTTPFNIHKTRLLTNQLGYVRRNENKNYLNPALLKF